MNKLEKYRDHQFEKPSVINNIPASQAAQWINAQGYFLYDEVFWPILHAEGEYDSRIMEALFDTVNQTYLRTSRFLAVRYDLHLKSYTDDNQVISDFCQQLAQVLRARYPKSFFDIFWVREHDKATAQHYHCVLMVDGNHIRTPKVLNGLVEKTWSSATNGKVWFPKNGYYMVHKRDSQTLGALLLRLSYFAKYATKTGIAKHIPLYGRKHYKVLKQQKPKPRTPAKLKQCQPPAERYCPLPGKLDPLFLGDNEPAEIDSLDYETNSQIRSIQRLLKLYQRGKAAEKPQLSPHWLRHFDRYYDNYWPCGVSVAQYCNWHDLNPSTARRYLCDYPPAVISPGILRGWLQKEIQYVIR
ncbi:inovirus Gp2 family protein [Escherichia coli]|uniref:YagK/YfjJ domain-containing protein n=1 Tax=Escherichia coli TaxID=562 RepID=UPI000B7D4577|nr:inovirus-type Gp2 protein [Escherichia coli]EGH0545400.1 inovirus Gp2 family protein [Escherichia coli]EGI6721880.1 inovirus Gp2 family protein [Escherichia coli]EHB5922134.1 inovirus Gp2 family protein [Escherichia coli]EHU9036123.1 inovirus-type Gp2 protein [Escherichia coli]EHU9089199.1 inovirus-type Gp2 protein [Escherichia coli]